MQNKAKFVLCHSSSGHKHALEEVLTQPVSHRPHRLLPGAVCLKTSSPDIESQVCTRVSDAEPHQRKRAWKCPFVEGEVLTQTPAVTLVTN